MQATVATFDPATGSGTVLTDDGRRIPYGRDAFAAGGLRLLRAGQRVRLETADGTAGDTVGGTVVRITLATLP